MMTRRRAAMAVVLSLCAGCSEQYVIEIVAGETSALDDGLGWELSIVSGGCDPEAADGGPGDPERIVRTLTWRIGDAAPEIGSLPAGRYGFLARVRDDSCTVRWAGCAELEARAGGGGLVTIQLADVDGPPCDDGLACTGQELCGPEGLCEATGAIECDDRIECTADACVEPGECSSEPDDAACPAGQICDRNAGCRPAEECGAEDADRDGFPCADDCDDGDEEVSPVANEICNGRDDDCDDEIDEDGSCGNQCLEQTLGQTTLLLCTEPRRWDDARAVCETEGAVLASGVIDETTLELARQFGGVFGDEFWIGPNDRDEERDWRDADGAPLEATQWVKGQPDGGDADDCAFFSLDAGGWNDASCDELRPSVCELR